MTMKRMLMAAGAAFMLLAGGQAWQAPAQAKTYVDIGVGIGVGVPAGYYDETGYDDWPRYRYRGPRTVPVYERRRWRPRRKVVRVYRQVCTRRIKVVRRWSYRHGGWVERRIFGPRRCWRERIR